MFHEMFQRKILFTLSIDKRTVSHIIHDSRILSNDLELFTTRKHIAQTDSKWN